MAPNDRFLDIDCGFGSLLLHASSRFGVDTYGITISKEQAAVAASRLALFRPAPFANRLSWSYRNGRAQRLFAAFDLRQNRARCDRSIFLAASP
ncbi:MAG: SAM-dependent methyltransferase [Acidobacteriaceae bacterium]